MNIIDETKIKYFMCFESENPSIVWGTGNSLKEARENGKYWVGDYKRFGGSESPRLKSIECEEKLFTYIGDNGGSNVKWEKNKKGIAVLT